MNRKLGVSAFLLVLCLLSSAWAQDNMQAVTDPVKVFGEGYLQVVGFSEEGQSRYKALRAAQVVAQRDLVEILQGLSLHGNTSVKDGMLMNDDINTSVEGFLRGATKCGQNYHEDKGYAEVCMRMNIRGRGGLYDILLPLIQNDQIIPEKQPEYKPSTAAVTNAAGAQTTPENVGQEAEVKAPSQLTNPHDGLIIDVRDFQFRPALVNRVLTDKDEVVFEPSKILSNVLVERGCGGFTTDDGKAKALLESWGSKNPMLVKSTDVRKLTDANISEDDAAAIYVHDKNTNILSQARVVFILK